MNQPTRLNYAINQKINVGKVFKYLLYFVGVFIAVFGLIGTIIEIDPVFFVGIIALSAGLGSFLLGIINFYRTRTSFEGSGCLQCIVWFFGTTVVSFIIFLLIVVLALDISKYLGGILSYSDVLLYGIALILLAYQKPSLFQQVREDVRRMLETMPSRQMPLSELIHRQQQQYHLSDTQLNQYIKRLDFIEQIDIPETGTIICRMKETKRILVFPQIATITNVELREHIERALLDLTEEKVDIGLFLLGREFETTLRAYLTVAYEKGKLTNIPGNKIPSKLALFEMISCLKSNGIITDDAVLSYLRQTRNDRAHGETPTLAERRLLMHNAHHLANLYIDYIQFFDELTRNL